MRLFKTIALLALVAGLALGQTSLTTTTLSAAVAAGDTVISVASATGMTAYSNQLNTVLYVGREAMDVVSISSTRITVRRSRAGSRMSAHPSAATVWIGPPAAFSASNPVAGSPCTLAELGYKPTIVPTTGQFFDCDSSTLLWYQLDNPEGLPLGTAATGVTAYEWGSARHRHVKLTFSGLTVGAPTGDATALGIGVLLYTAPAGTLVANSAGISVALADTGGCTTDTPDVGLGTVIASGATAVLSGTATFEDILTGQTADDVNGTAEVKTLSQGLGIETAGVHTVHLNVADTWDGDPDCAVTATGTVYLELLKLN